MLFSIRRTFRRLWSPQHKLACSASLWRQLVEDLRTRSAGARESGAFLLGHCEDDIRTITGFVLYDDLDPNALNSGYVHIDGRCMGRLWEICRQQKVSVIADVHTHPGGFGQSDTDRRNPMVAVKGHIGLILPDFAMGKFSRFKMGIYLYRGAHEWETVRTTQNSTFFYIGL
ncbi:MULTISPECIES: hypothetical protein [unclassified Caballeronia]|uniref:hypothetical protein n=1 Tax=unclassified Caballeronia TaxID=2646786 RepID=UPI0028609A76|nr:MULTISPECIES: hypothetical protein [unclassified Caballeronia]MDR5751294.1 hypothetical protein [Caballeronia sp. LZ024]MDR5844568.1 hypothetical protein [Caballeronia sp. LZ031]